jgi:hypothetical protein
MGYTHHWLRIIDQPMMEEMTEIEIEETVLNPYNSNRSQHGTHSPIPVI